MVYFWKDQNLPAAQGGFFQVKLLLCQLAELITTVAKAAVQRMMCEHFRMPVHLSPVYFPFATSCDTGTRASACFHCDDSQCGSGLTLCSSQHAKPWCSSSHSHIGEWSSMQVEIILLNMVLNKHIVSSIKQKCQTLLVLASLLDIFGFWTFGQIRLVRLKTSPWDTGLWEPLTGTFCDLIDLTAN